MLEKVESSKHSLVQENMKILTGDESSVYTYNNGILFKRKYIAWSICLCIQSINGVPDERAHLIKKNNSLPLREISSQIVDQFHQ